MEFNEKRAHELLPCQYPNILVKPTQPAPDFSGDAYFRGEKIIVNFEHYRGKWVALFFYASDFTFV